MGGEGGGGGGSSGGDKHTQAHDILENVIKPISLYKECMLVMMMVTPTSKYALINVGCPGSVAPLTSACKLS